MRFCVYGGIWVSLPSFLVSSRFHSLSHSLSLSLSLTSPYRGDRGGVFHLLLLVLVGDSDVTLVEWLFWPLLATLVRSSRSSHGFLDRGIRSGSFCRLGLSLPFFDPSFAGEVSRGFSDGNLLSLFITSLHPFLTFGSLLRVRSDVNGWSCGPPFHRFGLPLPRFSSFPSLVEEVRFCLGGGGGCDFSPPVSRSCRSYRHLVSLLFCHALVLIA